MTEWRDLPIEDCLEDLLDYRGKSPKKSETGIPVISAKVVKNGCILPNIEQTISPDYYNEWMRRGLPEVGDVVLTTEGPLGEIAQLDKQSAKYALGQRIVTLRGKKGTLLNSYLKYALLSPLMQQRLTARATGTTVLGISQKALRSVPLRLPDLAAQETIAHLLSSLDDKIELNRQMNKTLEAMAQAIFKDWFVDFGPTRRKLEGRTDPVALLGGLLPDPAKAIPIADLFPTSLGDNGLPEGWQEEPLLNHAKLISGGTPKTDNAQFWDGGILWASAKDVSQCGEAFLISTERSITELGLEKSSTKIVPRHAVVVVARGATTGRFCMFGRDIAMNQTCYGLQSEDEFPFWLRCAFSELVLSLVHAAHGSVFDTITTKTLRSASIVAGSKQIRSAFEEVVEALFERALTNIEEHQTLAQTRDLLLPKLMSGEIRVSDAEAMAAEVA